MIDGMIAIAFVSVFAAYCLAVTYKDEIILLLRGLGSPRRKERYHPRGRDGRFQKRWFLVKREVRNGREVIVDNDGDVWVRESGK